MSLLCIKNLNKNPYFNLAAEEYLLKNKQEDIFMLWQNEPTVVVGKHQNVYAEINLKFVNKNNIKIARRLSGGGTVYHDLGNINFSYIMNGQEGKMVNFTKYTDNILQALHSINVPAVRNKRNDLLIDNKKISGNAEHVFKNRVLHHGTLLFDSELEVLTQAIKVQNTKYIDKAVQSVRSKVTNISKNTDKQIDVYDFYNQIFNFIIEQSPNTEFYSFSPDEIKQIQKLEQEKYSSWDWIFGYSPKYELIKTITKLDKYVNIHLSIKKGIINDANIEGDLLEKQSIRELCNLLINKKHDKSALIEQYKQENANINEYVILIINSIF